MSTEIPDFNPGSRVEDLGGDTNFDTDNFESKDGDHISAVIEGVSEELGSETESALGEIVDGMSPDEKKRLQQLREGNIELTQGTLEKLKVLSARIQQVAERYKNKYGAEVAGVIVGGSMAAAGIPRGALGVAEYGSAGLILGVLTYGILDRAHNS